MKMNVKKLFQDFQNHGVCRRWKREVPGQADVSYLLNYLRRQKQSFHRCVSAPHMQPAMG